MDTAMFYVLAAVAAVLAAANMANAGPRGRRARGNSSGVAGNVPMGGMDKGAADPPPVPGTKPDRVAWPKPPAVPPRRQAPRAPEPPIM